LGRDRRSGPVALFPGGLQGDGVGEYVAELLELAEPGFLVPAPREAERGPDPAFDMQKRPCRMTPATIIKHAAPSRSGYSGQTERRVSRRTR